jgi:hypothetical protein
MRFKFKKNPARGGILLKNGDFFGHDLIARSDIQEIGTRRQFLNWNKETFRNRVVTFRKNHLSNGVA